MRNERQRLEAMRQRNQAFARKQGIVASCGPANVSSGTWRRETWCLPREDARDKTRAFLKKYPKAAYWSEVESWRELEGDVIEFTLRRLPSAD